jgi:hypothetical protein
MVHAVHCQPLPSTSAGVLGALQGLPQVAK